MNVFQVLGVVAVLLALYAFFRIDREYRRLLVAHAEDRRDLVAMLEANDARLAAAETAAKEALAASRRVIHMLEAQSKADQN